MSEYIIEEIDYKGFRIRISYDECAGSPREWSNLGKLVLFHPRYNFPNDANMTREEAIEFYNNFPDDVILLPVNMYEHGSVALSTGSGYPFNCRWDSSHIGFVYINVEDVINEYGEDYDREKIEQYLHNEVVEYGQYVNGEVYYVEIFKLNTCENCGNIEHKPFEGQGGYIGDWDEAIADAKALIDQEAVRYDQDS